MPVSIALFLAALLCWVRPVRAGQVVAAPGEARIDEAAEQLLRSGRSTGIAIAILHDGQILFAKGYGVANLEDGARVQPDTIFRIGSVTEQFTAAAIMLLAEQGKLSVDDTLVKFFPSFPRGAEVTIRELLSHTSGIHDYVDPEYFRTTMRMDRTTAEFHSGWPCHTSASDLKNPTRAMGHFCQL